MVDQLFSCLEQFVGVPGKFSRSFSVSEALTEADIHASFDNGVLKLEIPKKENPVPEKKRISVK